jgi:hypothetical protein
LISIGSVPLPLRVNLNEGSAPNVNDRTLRRPFCFNLSARIIEDTILREGAYYG